MSPSVVRVTNKGMISVPAEFRRKLDIKDGDLILVKEDDDGSLKVIPIPSIEKLRALALTVDEFKSVYRNSKQEDMESEG